METSKKVKIFIEDRNYSKWTFQDIDNNNEICMNEYPILKSVSPLEKKYLNKDVFMISNNSIECIYSSVRVNDSIAGILILEKNKTYGRTLNNKRLLYKCIPDDPHIPIFLIPYDVKIQFTKVYKNKYVVFKYDNWNDKHPQGILIDSIGDVDNLDAFYEYQLYCKSLHISISDFTDKTRILLNKNVQEQYIKTILRNPDFHIEDYRDKYVFTIDPNNSIDYDDGFSVIKMGDKTKVIIYIANVFFWLETLGLWNSFSKRVATIYLPDRRRPMLPTILSDTLCSLLEKQQRFAFAMEITIDNNTGDIIDVPLYKNVVINVNKNYSYEDVNLVYNDINYTNLFDITYKMNKYIKTSHDVVSFWMVKMNQIIGSYMATNKIGIFRATITNSDDNSCGQNNDYEILKDFNDDTRRAIQHWNNTAGKYVLFDDDADLNHFMMNSKYIHITSPIRRLVDLLNQMMLSNYTGITSKMSNDSILFLDKWKQQMEYINTSMRSIRKIQTDCFLLNRCFNSPTILENMYSGVLFDKIIKNDGTFHYMVYLEDLKLLSRIITHIDLSNYSISMFKLFLFENEYKTKKKIRLQIFM